MKPTGKYDYLLGENIVETGIFICPTCSRKREYKKIFRSYDALAEFFNPYLYHKFKEYLHCQGCLERFPVGVLETVFQSSIKADKELLPPATILDLWQSAYINLKCEELISWRTIIVRKASPRLFTLANGMKTVGANLHLGKYKDARKYLIAIIVGAEESIKKVMMKSSGQDQLPQHDKKTIDQMEAHMEAAHFLLSLLP